MSAGGELVVPAPVRVASSAPPATGEPRVVRVVQLLQLALLLLVVANLGRLPVLDTGGRAAAVLLNDLMVALVLGAGALVALRRRSLVLDRVALAALLFATVGAVSATITAQRYGLGAFQLAVSLGYLARWLFYFGVYVVATNVVRARDVVPTWRALETAILLFAGFGVFQSAFLPNFAQLVYPESRAWVDWDVQGHRLVSTILDPNFAGALVLAALLVQLAGLVMGARVSPWKPALLFVALVLTVSRSSILAFAAGGAVVLLIRGLSRRVIQLVVAGGVVLALAAPAFVQLAERYDKLTLDVSGLSRIVMWLRGVRVLVDHPVLGIGFNTWGFVQERYGWERGAAATYGIEGGLLFIAVLTGAVGTAIFVWMLREVTRRARRVWRDATRPVEERALAAGTVAFIVAMLVHSLFTNSLLLPILMEVQWVLWALVAVLAREGATGAHEEPAASATPTASRVVTLAAR